MCVCSTSYVAARAGDAAKEEKRAKKKVCGTAARWRDAFVVNDGVTIGWRSCRRWQQKYTRRT